MVPHEAFAQYLLGLAGWHRKHQPHLADDVMIARDAVLERSDVGIGAAWTILQGVHVPTINTLLHDALRAPRTVTVNFDPGPEYDGAPFRVTPDPAVQRILDVWREWLDSGFIDTHRPFYTFGINVPEHLYGVEIVIVEQRSTKVDVEIVASTRSPLGWWIRHAHGLSSAKYTVSLPLYIMRSRGNGECQLQVYA